MKLNLTKPLIVFDLETTGLDLVKDRIIQISYIKVNLDGSEERVNQFVNPGCTIPPEVVTITGITNEQVKDAPLFKDIAKETCKQPSMVATSPASTPTTSTFPCWQKSFFVQA